MSAETVYLISGASRGIGLGLVTSLAARPSTVVFAGVRDGSASYPALEALAKQHPGQVHTVQLTSGSEEDNRAAVKEIESKAGHLDVVIANAGITKFYGPIATTPLSEFRDHWEVNALGVVTLFQAAFPLLAKSPSKAPKFVVISTGAASMENYVNITAGAYGSSKAAVNFLVCAAHAENEAIGLIAFAMNPGWVQTDMGNAGAKANGMEAAPVKLKDSVDGILGVIDTSTREKSGGKFLDFVKGDKIPW